MESSGFTPLYDLTPPMALTRLPVTLPVTLLGMLQSPISAALIVESYI